MDSTTLQPGDSTSTDQNSKDMNERPTTDSFLAPGTVFISQQDPDETLPLRLRGRTTDEIVHVDYQHIFQTLKHGDTSPGRLLAEVVGLDLSDEPAYCDAVDPALVLEQDLALWDAANAPVVSTQCLWSEDGVTPEWMQQLLQIERLNVPCLPDTGNGVLGSSHTPFVIHSDETTTSRTSYGATLSYAPIVQRNCMSSPSFHVGGVPQDFDQEVLLQALRAPFVLDSQNPVYGDTEKLSHSFRLKASQQSEIQNVVIQKENISPYEGSNIHDPQPYDGEAIQSGMSSRQTPARTYPSEILELVDAIRALGRGPHGTPFRKHLKDGSNLSIRAHFCSQLGTLRKRSILRDYVGDPQLFDEEWWVFLTTVNRRQRTSEVSA